MITTTNKTNTKQTPNTNKPNVWRGDWTPLTTSNKPSKIEGNGATFNNANAKNPTTVTTIVVQQNLTNSHPPHVGFLKHPTMNLNKIDNANAAAAYPPKKMNTSAPAVFPSINQLPTGLAKAFVNSGIKSPKNTKNTATNATTATTDQKPWLLLNFLFGCLVSTTGSSTTGASTGSS